MLQCALDLLETVRTLDRLADTTSKVLKTLHLYRLCGELNVAAALMVELKKKAFEFNALIECRLIELACIVPDDNTSPFAFLQREQTVCEQMDIFLSESDATLGYLKELTVSAVRGGWRVLDKTVPVHATSETVISQENASLTSVLNDLSEITSKTWIRHKLLQSTAEMSKVDKSLSLDWHIVMYRFVESRPRLKRLIEKSKAINADITEAPLSLHRVIRLTIKHEPRLIPLAIKVKKLVGRLAGQ
jgi:hypothetical protein